MKKKHIIILGALMLLLVFVVGGITYRNKEEAQRRNTLFSHEGERFSTFRYSEDYPISALEVESFEEFCAQTATPHFMASVDKFTEQDILVNYCYLNEYFSEEENDLVVENKYIPIFAFMEELPALSQSRYIAIAINKDDLLKKSKDFILSEKNFNVCAITEPALINPYREELQDEDRISSYITFPEGNIICNESLILPDSNLVLSGFIPNPEEISLFELRLYLIPNYEDIKDDLLNSKTFSDIEEILSSHFLLWQVEKPII